jgi:hypothetical protein
MSRFCDHQTNRLPPNFVNVTRLCDVVSDPNDNTPDSEGLASVAVLAL